MTFDEIRAAHPDLRFTLYGMAKDKVTLEIITPDDQIFTFDAPTAQAAIDDAFPPEVDPEPAAPVSAFD